MQNPAGAQPEMWLNNGTLSQNCCISWIGKLHQTYSSDHMLQRLAKLYFFEIHAFKFTWQLNDTPVGENNFSTRLKCNMKAEK